MLYDWLEGDLDVLVSNNLMTTSTFYCAQGMISVCILPLFSLALCKG